MKLQNQSVYKYSIESKITLHSIVLNYYQLIDEQKIDEVLNLFAETAYYARCEEVFSGIKALENFYKNERQITGYHEIKNLLIIGQTAIVEGIFRGKGADGKPKKVSFADFFTFNDEGKVQNRHTYLMLGGSYVKA